MGTTKTTKIKTGEDLIQRLKTEASDYDTDVIRNWIREEGEVVFYKVNKYNLCVFMKTVFKEDEESSFEYAECQFIRFFHIGGKTVASVDFDTNRVGEDPLKMLAMLLNNKFGQND